MATKQQVINMVAKKGLRIEIDDFQESFSVTIVAPKHYHFSDGSHIECLDAWAKPFNRPEYWDYVLSEVSTICEVVPCTGGFCSGGKDYLDDIDESLNMDNCESI